MANTNNTAKPLEGSQGNLYTCLQHKSKAPVARLICGEVQESKCVHIRAPLLVEDFESLIDIALLSLKHLSNMKK